MIFLPLYSVARAALALRDHASCRASAIDAQALYATRRFGRTPRYARYAARRIWRVMMRRRYDIPRFSMAAIDTPASQPFH
jgi:hypothetical protein